MIVSCDVAENELRPLGRMEGGRERGVSDMVVVRKSQRSENGRIIEFAKKRTTELELQSWIQCRYETGHTVTYFFSCDPRLTHLCMPQRECANVPLETVVRSDDVRIRSAYRGITSIIEKCIRIDELHRSLNAVCEKEVS